MRYFHCYNFEVSHKNYLILNIFYLVKTLTLTRKHTFNKTQTGTRYGSNKLCMGVWRPLITYLILIF